MTYFIAVEDAQRHEWLTIVVAVDGPAGVVGRWATKEQAEDDACRWWSLESAAT